MAGKFWAAALVSAFISLSGAAAEPRRCYWCGPLAEQVHRSRRSASCGASAHVTVCEPGYDYCAVVATSPPRVESRYCVKMYQDECYPLFCNTTKTWKMTCPCRGDLCNGPNTARETDAFALLPKLVAKTNNRRIKKRNANASPHLIKHDGKTSNVTSENLIVTVDDDYPSDPSDYMHSDQPINTVVEHHVETENDALNAANESSGKPTTTINQLIEIEIHISDTTEERNGTGNGKENGHPCTASPSTSEHDHPSKVKEEPLSQGEWLIMTTIEIKQDNNYSTITESKDSTTTEPVQQNDTEVNTTNAPFDLTTKREAEKMANNDLKKPGDSASTTETTITSTLKIEEVKEPEIPAEPVNQMQIHVPLTNSVNSGQSMSSTASTMVTETTLKIEEVTEPEIPAEPVNQMQTHVPLNNSVNSDQSMSSTASTMVTETTLKIEEVTEPGIPAEPVNQMQTHVPLNNSVNSDQSMSSTASTMVTETTLKIEEVTEPGIPAEPVNQMQTHVPLNNSVNNDQSMSSTGSTMITQTTLKIEEVTEPEIPAEPVNQMQTHVPLNNSVNNDQSMSSTGSTMITQTTFKIEVEDLGINKGSEDQMQNDAPIDSAQPESTTATTLIQVTTLNDEVKPSKEMPTAEALQQDGSSAKTTEKTLQAADEATTVNTVAASTNNIVEMTTPRSRRKNNTSRININYTLLLSCFVYLLM